MLRVPVIQEAIGNLKNNLLFLHAVTGSDTTSAPCQQGKKKGCRLMESNNQLKQIVTVFSTPQANPEDIAKAGEECLLYLYGASTFNSSDDFRLAVFKRKNPKKSMKCVFQVGNLPPASASAGQYSFRTYCQVQQQHQSNCMRVNSI